MKVKIAKTYWARLIGLIGRRLDLDEGLFIPHCRQVHTFFMREPIDVVFVNRESRIVAIHTLSPWRISPLYKEAAACLELSEGGAKRANLSIGFRLDPVVEFRIAKTTR